MSPTRPDRPYELRYVGPGQRPDEPAADELCVWLRATDGKPVGEPARAQARDVAREAGYDPDTLHQLGAVGPQDRLFWFRH